MNTTTQPKVKFLNQWNEERFEAIEKAIVRHFLKAGTIKTHKGRHYITILDTFESIDKILGLAYTSSSSYAGYWICNVELRYENKREKFFRNPTTWNYNAFTIGTDGKFYATIQDKYENEFIIEL